jgi:hypothetical protein
LSWKDKTPIISKAIKSDMAFLRKRNTITILSIVHGINVSCHTVFLKALNNTHNPHFETDCFPELPRAPEPFFCNLKVYE